MPLHDGQLKYLRNTQKLQTRKNILTCANRYGKSTLIACLHVWYLFYKIGINADSDLAWTNADYRTANIAPHSALIEPVFNAIDAIMTGRFLIPSTNKTNKCEIKWFYLTNRTQRSGPYRQFFDNGSYIEHKSLGGDQGDALQGKPYGLITYDEGARSDHLENELDDAILPRLMDWHAPLHILSTPSQTSHSTMYYHKLYQNGLLGMDSTYTQEGSIFENSFFSKEQIDAQVDLYKDNPLRDQVLYGKFIWGGDTLFPAEDIESAEDMELNDGIRYEEGHNYVVGIDTAIGSDEMVYTVLDVTQKPYRLVRMLACKGNSKSPQMHLNDLLDLIDSYRKDNNIQILLETWNGESARFYQDLPPYVRSFTRCYGAWQPEKIRTDNKNPNQTKTSNIKKADLLLALKKSLASKEIRIPKFNKELVQQMYIYKEDDKRLKTDRIISLALATWLAYDVRVTTPTFQTVAW